MTEDAIAAKDERIRELEQKLANYNETKAVIERNVKIQELEKRNQELRVKISEEQTKKHEIAQEVKERDYTISRLQEKYAVIAELGTQETIAQLKKELADQKNRNFTDCAGIVAQLKKLYPQKKVSFLKVAELEKAIALASEKGFLADRLNLPDRESST